MFGQLTAVAVCARVSAGKIRTGEDLEVVGLVPTQKTICTGK